MQLKLFIILIASSILKYASSAPVIETVYQTRTIGVAVVSSSAPVATETLTSAITGTEVTTSAVNAEDASPTTLIPASNANTSSPLSDLSSIFGNSMLNKLLAILGMSADDLDSETSSSPVSIASTSSTIAAQANTIINKLESASSITTTRSTSSKAIPTTLSTATLSSSSARSSSDIYSEIADSDGVDITFAKDTLDIHNKYRALHGVPDMSWDATVYAYAKANADNYDCSGILTENGGPYGENLAAGYSSGPASVTAWYNEGTTFDYSTDNTYNHFTQVVWKGSSRLGCAYKDCRAENWGLYVICNYDPVGNVIGEEAANVLPLVKS